MPNFLIIGAAKCGTTSLNRYLDLHPQIAMAKLKEPKYFIERPAPEFLREFPEFAGNHIRDRDRYLALFEAGTPLRGESSTAYSSFPQFPGVPAAIHREVPEMKLVYLVRDPVERSVSQWVQWMGSTSSYRRDLARREGLDGLLRDPLDPSPSVLSSSLYMSQIREYMRYFPRESLLVVDSADLDADRRATLSRIFSFLGANPDFWDERMLQRANEGVQKREVFSVYMYFREIGIAWELLNRLPEGLRARLVGLALRALSKPIERPIPNARQRMEIEKAVVDDVAELREFTGLDFSTWSV